MDLVLKVVTQEAVLEAECVIRGNSCVTVNEVAATLDSSYGSSYCMIHNVLQFHKVFANLMPG
jgi:hypothetical protein